MQAQGLLQQVGDRDVFQQAVLRHCILLAAHGPYTAEGVGKLVGMSVSCISKDFSSFDGLVHAVEAVFRAGEDSDS